MTRWPPENGSSLLRKPRRLDASAGYAIGTLAAMQANENLCPSSETNGCSRFYALPTWFSRRPKANKANQLLRSAASRELEVEWDVNEYQNGTTLVKDELHNTMASIVRSTTNRAVHLRIFPRPSNLGESRELLRLISQFGEVEYFKSLKYDHLSAPNAALVIYKDEDAAQHSLRRSPIRFRMGKAMAGESTSQPLDSKIPEVAPTSSQPAENPFSAPNPAPVADASNALDAMDRELAATPQPSQQPLPTLTDSRLYQIQVHPARVHFRDQINAGHYHGSFPIDTKSVAQGDLAKSVPLNGLSCVDWRAGDKPWRILRKEQFQEHESWNKRKSLRELYEHNSKTTPDTNPQGWAPHIG